MDPQETKIVYLFVNELVNLLSLSKHSTFNVHNFKTQTQNKIQNTAPKPLATHFYPFTEFEFDSIIY